MQERLRIDDKRIIIFDGIIVVIIYSVIRERKSFELGLSDKLSVPSKA